MATFARLVVPSFDLTWLQHEEAAYVLIPGGGGSTKSGVKNQIQIAREKGGQLIFEESFKTDTGDKSRLCSGIHCGVLQVLFPFPLSPFPFPLSPFPLF